MLTENNNEFSELTHLEMSLIDTEKNYSSVVSDLITTVEPQKFFSVLDFKELWDYRELFYFLILRDVKIRYKQTLLGIAWVVLQPIITTVIFTTIFFRIGSEQELGVAYPLFAFSGFTLWTFINSSIINCTNSLVNHSNLITKVYFPRLIIPLSAVCATLLDLLLGLASLFVAMLVYRVHFKWQILLLPFSIIPALLLSLGFGIMTAALNVKYRDIKHILPFLLQIFLFISPVFYSLSILPEGSVWLWKLNPVSGILVNFRALLFDLKFDWPGILISTAISIFVFASSIYLFYRMEDDFADVI